MIYELILKGYSFGKIYGDSLFEYLDIELSYYLITYGEFNKALNGKTFSVLGKGKSTEEMELPSCNSDVFYYYYQIFERCFHFGLPQGKGWIEEPDWILNLVQFLKPIRNYYFSGSQNEGDGKSPKF